MKDCQNMGCLARGTEWCYSVSAPTDTKPSAVTCYGYMPLIADDLISDEPIPDSAWTEKVPDGVLHGSIKMSASK